MSGDYEDLTDYGLDPLVEERLLSAQTECTFVWSSKSGWPLGVVMSFLVRDGRFWLTASSQRGRVAALRSDPRAAIVVSSAGTELGPQKSVTYRGTCAIHDDRPTKDWFYPALGLRRFPSDAAYRREFVRRLDSPRRVILELVPGERIAYDGAKMHRGAVRRGA
jgi:hypothetical protein